jgi:hypothetical protein
VAKLLRSGATEGELVDYLQDVEENTMGLSNPDDQIVVGRALIAWYAAATRRDTG